MQVEQTGGGRRREVLPGPLLHLRVPVASPLMAEPRETPREKPRMEIKATPRPGCKDLGESG